MLWQNPIPVILGYAWPGLPVCALWLYALLRPGTRHVGSPPAKCVTYGRLYYGAGWRGAVWCAGVLLVCSAVPLRSEPGGPGGTFAGRDGFYSG